ncbi:hypothetical protein SDC9_177004 [bioreactor metagenome]|uniref:Uncharacterized protein n=1 Tax=bioreactor metagenome TaxID=1076179 RepID=A0A645GRR0_9ZZZZ
MPSGCPPGPGASPRAAHRRWPWPWKNPCSPEGWRTAPRLPREPGWRGPRRPPPRYRRCIPALPEIGGRTPPANGRCGWPPARRTCHGPRCIGPRPALRLCAPPRPRPGKPALPGGPGSCKPFRRDRISGPYSPFAPWPPPPRHRRLGFWAPYTSRWRTPASCPAAFRPAAAIPARPGPCPGCPSKPARCRSWRCWSAGTAFCTGTAKAFRAAEGPGR